VNNPVQNGIGKSAFTDLCVPASRRELGKEDGRTLLVAGLRNLQHVAGFRRLSGRQQPLVQNKQFGAFVLLHHLLVSAGAMNHGQIVEQFGQPDICGEIPAQV